MVKTLNQILAEYGRTVNDITKVYRGKDHACRCGCCGKYFDKGEKGFTRAVNQMNKPDFETWDVENFGNGINIPYNADSDMCFAIYFN